MAVTVYKSSDTSAPVLSGSAGALITVLDAVLVNGYGAKTAAGWTKPFTGTNAADYRMSTVSPALGYYLDVNDNGPGAATFQEARIRGFEAMTALATGSRAFPTTAQLANGVFVRKSSSLNAVVRPWIIIADSRTFYMFIQTGDVAGSYLSWGFGEFYSMRTLDSGRAIILGRTTENTASAAVEPFPQFSLIAGSTNVQGNNSRFFARPYDLEVGSQVAGNNVGDSALDSGRNLDFTNASDNKVYSAPIRLIENTTTQTGVVRGRYRGLWHWSHSSTSVSDGDTFTGSGDLAGRTFLILKSTFNTTGMQGVIALETSNTWDTNAS